MSVRFCVLNLKAKNPNDQRIEKRPKESTVFYLPITKDLANRLELAEGDYVIAELTKATSKAIQSETTR